MIGWAVSGIYWVHKTTGRPAGIYRTYLDHSKYHIQIGNAGNINVESVSRQLQTMRQDTTKFQCYLILGSTPSARLETEKIAQQHKVNLKKTSPDIFFIAPLKQSISIEEVRELKKHIFQKPIDLSHKMIIFHEAHKLTTEAQNALLKILEEPPKNVIIILEAQNKENLLPTIRSRVVTVETKRNFNLKGVAYFPDNNLKDLLSLLPTIEDPQGWLDNQILLAYEKIASLAKGKAKQNNLKQQVLVVEKCIKTKKMISSNINATFALANLFFSTARGS